MATKTRWVRLGSSSPPSPPSSSLSSEEDADDDTGIRLVHHPPSEQQVLSSPPRLNTNNNKRFGNWRRVILHGSAWLIVPLLTVQVFVSFHSDVREVAVVSMVEAATTALPVAVISNNNSHSSSSSNVTQTPKNNHNWTRPFPRWGDDNSNEDGIVFSELLQFIRGVLHRNATTLPRQHSREPDFPETLYVVDRHGVWVSRSLRQRTAKIFVRNRAVPTESMFVQAWKLLWQESTTTAPTNSSTSENATLSSSVSSSWPHLRRALEEHDYDQSSGDGGGFPFVAWYGDYLSCSTRNWLNRTSIPLFTVCGRIDCPHAFVLPTYRTILDSQPRSSDWVPILQQYQRQYPWESKVRKLVWRGSLSGDLAQYTSPRARIGQFAAAHSKDIFDIGITRIPDRHLNRDKTAYRVNLTAIGGLANKMAMIDFQRYLAILDLDGNSWSSRFGALLCYNSVIVKVEPHYVDYFHFRYLEPWKHYVPVAYDLRDLQDKVQYVLDPANEVQVRAIVAAANEWCQAHMVHTAIAHDVLDIWDQYVQSLDRQDDPRGNPDEESTHVPRTNWSQLWKMEKAQFVNSPDFAMYKLPMKG